ncbi:MAG: ACT domain-containing protein [Erysipelotrichaceae bacterium]|nr:ACT domain-containing protein [Erysipelotrichaceae bacterium]
MASDFLIVHKKILPDYLEKVIEARELISRHEASSVTEAVRIVGISRNTFYKYKDCVWRAESSESRRRAIIALVLQDEAGSLSSVLSYLSDAHLSVITISQSIPVAYRAAVTISLDITEMEGSADAMLDGLRKLPNVLSAYLEAME